MSAHEVFNILRFGARFHSNRTKCYKEHSQSNQKESAIETNFSAKSKENSNEPVKCEFQHDFEESEGSLNVKKRRKNDKTKSVKNKRMKLDKQKAHEEKVFNVRKKHKIYVWGSDVADPCDNFDEITKDFQSEELKNNVDKLNFTSPTPIQMQAIPIMLKRREILACAPTGSGKTLAFVVPLLAHLNKPERIGFRAVIVEPTRELSLQTYRVIVQMAENTSLKVHMIMNVDKAAKRFGKKTNKPFDVLVTTPNRLVCLLKRDPPALDLSKTEWLIVDESDKLFESGEGGFREQLGVIYQACDNVNLRRAFFSATFSYEVEQWCKLNLDNVIMVCVGARNSTVDTVDQQLTFVGDEHGKLVALRDLIRRGLSPPILIFVQTKERAEQLNREMICEGMNVDVIHSDRTQQQRNDAVKRFRSGNLMILICTELLGRGIDFKNVNVVINYDFPTSSISYIHRIGRTGRAGRSGRAITFFSEKDRVLLRSIANVMKTAGCSVPEYMLELKKPSRLVKRKLATKAVGRECISDLLPSKSLRKKRKIKKAKSLVKKS